MTTGTTTTVRWVRWLGLSVVPGMIAVACGGSAPPPKTATVQPTATAKTPEAVREVVIPRTCAARTKLAQLLGHADTPPAAQLEQSSAAEPPPTSVATSTKLASNQAYRVIAPSTVLIRAEQGFGTGVVIDPKGYILTNYHVVADGRKKDFVITVDVTFGDLTATGRMNRQTQSYEAEVVKADPVRDMAIVKVKDAPPKLVAAKLAKSDPQIAEKVMSVGHAGIGFLWAAKTCNIASIGERAQDSSIVAGFDCTKPDPALSADQAAKQKKACEEQKKRMTDALTSKTQGLAVQSDCAITHGDSGGPLVNMAGEVVGLNQSISADLATASFHVHLEEIRDFSTKYGDAGIPILPDPYCDGGFDPTLEDLDLDGVAESLVAKGGTTLFGGFDRMSLLVDLDQNQGKRKDAKDATGDSFDAELALMVLKGATYVWYDTDDNGKFDVLLVDKDSNGAPEVAYHIDDQGRLKEDKEILPKHDLSGKFVKDAALHPRLGKVASAIGGAKYVSSKTLASASDALTVPDPFIAAGTDGRAMDADGNGKSDVVVLRGAFSRVTLIDADETSLSSVKPGESAEDLLKAKKVDAEIAIVVQGTSVWALYDTDNDAKFDLALTSSNGDASVATGAWHLGKGAPTAAPENVGRKLLRPGLVGFPRAAPALRALSSETASDEGLGSLPAPMPSKAAFKVHDVKGSPAGTAVEAASFPWSYQLFDIDHNTKIPPKTDVQKVIADGKYDAEVAVVRRIGADGIVSWVYYDTDGDGAFDLVLFVPKSGQDPTQAFRLTKKDKTATVATLEADTTAVAGKPLRHKSVFKDKVLAAKWKTLANAVFKSDIIEP